jgi:hypothetical protein
VIPAAIAGITGFQRRFEPWPRVDSGTGRRRRKLSWGQHQMIIRQGQPELFFQPGQILAQAIGRASQSPVVLAQRQVLSRHIAGVDGRAGGQRRWANGDGVGFATDGLGRHPHDVSSAAVFDDLRLEQIWRRDSSRRGEAPSIPVTSRLNPLPIDVQQGGAVLGQLIAGEQRTPLSGDVTTRCRNRCTLSWVRLPTTKACTVRL